MTPKYISISFCLLILGAAQPAMGQVPVPLFRPSTGVASPPPFRYTEPANVHRNWAEAVGDIPDVHTHLGAVKRYLGQLASFNTSVNAEYSRIQVEANRRGTPVCRDYQAVVVGVPGEMPDSINLRPTPARGHAITAATGKEVDALSSRGQELMRQWLNNTRIGEGTFCAVPNLTMPNLPVVPNTTGPALGGVNGGYSLFGPQAYTGPSLMNNWTAPSFSVPRYSLGVDVSTIGRGAQAWQSSMEAQYPWLRSR
jgi:hypothetical protein